MDGEVKYTSNWIPPYKRNLRKCFDKPNLRPLRYLEIGVYEARSMVMVREKFLKHPDSEAFGIDPWVVSEMSKRGFPDGGKGKERMSKIEERARKNVSVYDNVHLIKESSQEYLRYRPFPEEHFDLIYIDGVHHTLPVLLDAVFCWPLVKVGGVVVWDDYTMGRQKSPVKPAVDNFLEAMKGDWEDIFKNCQRGVRKIKKPTTQEDYR